MKIRDMGLVFSVAAALAAQAAFAQDELERTPSAEGARVYFIAPQDGAIVTSPVTVIFGLQNMGVAPAGIEKDNTGHHHLIVNGELPPMDENIISDDTYLHFGGGQTETQIELAPGQHTLQLIFADKDHIPHDPPVYSDQITITVEDAAN